MIPIYLSLHMMHKVFSIGESELDSYSNIPTPSVRGMLFVTGFGYSLVPFFHKNKTGHFNSLSHKIEFAHRSELKITPFVQDSLGIDTSWCG